MPLKLKLWDHHRKKDDVVLGEADVTINRLV